MNKHYKALELDKILNRLADFTGCADARDMAENLEPEHNISLAKVLLQQTDDAYMLMAKFGAPSFGGLKNVNNSLSRANAGSVLDRKSVV